MRRDPQPAPPATPESGGLRPWHLLVLGVLAGSAGAVVVTQGSSAINIVMVTIVVATAALVAAGVFRSLAPLIAADAGEETEMVGGRTRAALEREKMMVLRSIKEVEFDRAMGKISDADFLEVSSRLRSRAASLFRQIDGGGGYRDLIERDLARLVGTPARPPAGAAAAIPKPVAGTCASCGVANDHDARFCKSCGTPLGVTL